MTSAEKLTIVGLICATGLWTVGTALSPRLNLHRGIAVALIAAAIILGVDPIAILIGVATTSLRRICLVPRLRMPAASSLRPERSALTALCCFMQSLAAWLILSSGWLDGCHTPFQCTVAAVDRAVPVTLLCGSVIGFALLHVTYERVTFKVGVRPRDASVALVRAVAPALAAGGDGWVALGSSAPLRFVVDRPEQPGQEWRRVTFEHDKRRPLSIFLVARGWRDYVITGELKNWTATRH